jgi:hypothetical protein
MKIDPGFTNHWKTELLIDKLGGDGVVAVLRLWGAAQIRRRFTGLEFTPKRLAMETKWKGDADQLFSVLTDPDAPWLDKEPDGTFTIHGFAEHQHQVVKLWENGKKGGRPRKVSPRPSSKDSSSSTSSSSSPICEPNGNHMVSEPKPARKKPAATGTLDELKAFAQEIGLPASDGEATFFKWEGNGWKNGNNSVKDWRSTMRSWKAAGYMPSQKLAKSATDHRDEKRSREWPEPTKILPRLLNDEPKPKLPRL